MVLKSSSQHIPPPQQLSSSPSSSSSASSSSPSSSSLQSLTTTSTMTNIATAETITTLTTPVLTKIPTKEEINEQSSTIKAFTKYKQYKMVPPEGGWGFIILLGMAACFTLTIGILPCFALLFGDFIKELGQGTQAIALVTSTYFMTLSIFGLFAKFLFEKFTVTTVGRVGGLVFFIGSILTIFVNSVGQLVFTYGILQGCGFGVMLCVSYTTFNKYFIKKRIMMMSLAQTFVGIGSMLLPHLIAFLMYTFGLRGTLAIVAAINGHALLGMLVMHPVEWHMKKISIPESEYCCTMEEHLTLKKIDKLENNENNNNNNIDDVNDKLLITSNWSINNNKNIFNNNNLKYRTKSMVSLGSYVTDLTICDLKINDNSNGVRNNMKNGISTARKKIIDFLDLTLLKDIIYLNIALGMSFALYSDLTFFTIEPLYLKQLKFTERSIADVICVGAGADLLSRFFLSITTSFVSITARNLYLLGAIFTVIFRIAFLFVNDYFGITILTGIIGFFRAWVHVPISLAIAEHVPIERFPSGHGLFLFIEGITIFMLGPLIGWIHDVTNSYTITFNCLTFVMAMCAVPWLIEMIWIKLKSTSHR